MSSQIPRVISVYAPTRFDPYDSYGLIGCELVRHWSRLGWYVNPISIGDPIHPNQDKELLAATMKPIRVVAGGVLLGYPTNYAQYGALANLNPRIALTMFESTKIPPGWTEELNKCGAVITPSNFCKGIFEQCGVKVPIHVVPLGIDDRYKAVERTLEDPFVFLTFLDRGRRKGGLRALESFVRVFGDRKDVKLIVKMRRTNKPIRLSFTNENIEVIDEDLTVEGLRNLYWNCHCLLNPNKGEGYGLIPREFAATGGISLATAWGGTAEHIHLWGWPIAAAEVSADWTGAKNLEGKDLGNWAEPDLECLEDLMEDVVEKRVMYQDKAYQRGRLLPQIFSWHKFSYDVLEHWKEVALGDYRYTTAS